LDKIFAQDAWMFRCDGPCAE